MKNLFLAIIFFFQAIQLFGQSAFYQDIFYGGVCVTGTPTSDSPGTVIVPFHVEPGSIIRKILLITYTQFRPSIPLPNFNVLINGQGFEQATAQNMTVFCSYNYSAFTYDGHRVHISDITNDLILTGNSLEITMNVQIAPLGCPSCRYAAPVLVIFYENSSLPLINVYLAINNGVSSETSQLNLEDFNPVDYSQDIGMGVHSDRLAGNPLDGYNYTLNSMPIGQNNEEDLITLTGGTIGTFYYQNNNLIGLTDDIANNTLSGSDGILLINNYVGTNINPVNIEYSYLEPTATVHNVLVGLYFAYSTPCERFDVTTSNDTTLCQGVNLQLNASASTGSATAYEWQPSTGLSCTDCPNPILTTDSTRLYTIRIFNNDSCSVIRPVMIHVREKPKFQSVLINPTICGSTTGRISVSASSATSYSLNNGTWQSGALFLNLAEGNYTVSILDAFGCQNDTLVTLGYQNATQAIFNVNPNAGAAPLSVQLSNQSVNANLFQWSINGLPFAGDLTNYTFDTSGVYVIQLIASNNFAYCADTAFLTVFVYDSLVVTIPNVFSPNGDGINDFYSISANQDVSYNFQILNRWGNEIIGGNGTLQAGNSKQIWDGSTITDGVYFIHLKIVDSENQQYQFQEFITVKN